MSAETGLQHIQNNRKIDRFRDAEFFFALEQALLLHLKDHGYLNEMQYRLTEKKLRRRYDIKSKSRNRGELD